MLFNARSWTVLPLALAPLASAYPNPALAGRQVPDGPCVSGVHIIAASGDGAANIGGYGLLETLVTSIVDAIPNSDNVTLPYPKADPNGLSKTTVGAQNLVQYLNDYRNGCPNTKIVLAGYSAGGIITMNTLCGASPPWAPTTGLDNSWTNNIIATIIYGDETHTAGQSYNVGSCTGSGRFPRSNTAGCDAFASDIQSYCNAEDPQCCSGFVPDSHFSYPEFDSTATQYVVAKFEAAQPPVSSSSSSSAPPPPPTSTESSTTPTSTQPPPPPTTTETSSEAPPPPTTTTETSSEAPPPPPTTTTETSTEAPPPPTSSETSAAPTSTEAPPPPVYSSQPPPPPVYSSEPPAPAPSTYESVVYTTIEYVTTINGGTTTIQAPGQPQPTPSPEQPAPPPSPSSPPEYSAPAPPPAPESPTPAPPAPQPSTYESVVYTTIEYVTTINGGTIVVTVPAPGQPTPQPEQPAPPAPESPAPEPPAPAPESPPPAQPTVAPAPAPVPAPSPANPSPAPPSAPTPISQAPPSGGPSCPIDLDGPYEFPHLIVPVSKCQPDTAFGTSYNGKVDDDVSSLFNFDIPNETAGKTCSVVFFLPNAEDLTTSSYAVSGDGSFYVKALSSPALESTTYNSVPEVTTDFGSFTISPGTSGILTSGPCDAGARIGYKMGASGDYSLEYFQNKGTPPIGLYIRVC